MAAQLRAYVHARRGSLAEAEADATSALDHPGLFPGLPPYGALALVDVMLAKGKPAEAADAFTRAASGHARSLGTSVQTRQDPHHHRRVRAVVNLIIGVE